MKIEAGKYYRTRDGDVVGPMRLRKDQSWYSCYYQWNEDGGIFSSGADHGLDLIAEVYVSDTPPGVYASEAEQDRDVFFNRLGRITEELNLPMDATASRIIEAIRALSDTPPVDAPAQGAKTLRDEFAGYAIIGLLAAGDCHAFNRDEMAVEAYRQADAMMEARRK